MIRQSSSRHEEIIHQSMKISQLSQFLFRTQLSMKVSSVSEVMNQKFSFISSLFRDKSLYTQHSFSSTQTQKKSVQQREKQFNSFFKMMSESEQFVFSEKQVNTFQTMIATVMKAAFRKVQQQAQLLIQTLSSDSNIS